MPPLVHKAFVVVHVLQKSALASMLLAVALLLVAQQGAQWHSYTHADGRLLDTTAQTALASHSACDDCLGFAPLLATAGAPAGVARFALPLQRSTPLARLTSVLNDGVVLAFRSRAPPR